jgi:hypothetical protein
MSHFTVLVIGEDYEEQLAPYDESITVAPYRDYADEELLAFYIKQYADDHEGAQAASDEDMVSFLNQKWSDDVRELRVDETGIYRLSTYNPNSKWDWYSVGGRWTGYFKVKEGVAVGSSQLGESGAFDNKRLHDADIVYKGDIDIEGMRSEAGEHAGDRWDQVQEVIVHLDEAAPWSTFVDRVKWAERDGVAYRIDEAREEYHAQPRVKALRASENEEIRWASIEDFQCSRDECVEGARLNAVSTYAYVKDGEWFAPGQMGWWGMSSDTNEEHDRFVWDFNEMLDELPDDTLLTLVDCHI